MNMNPNLKYDVVIESPGRINLIGEHVDYSGGHVLPASIDKKITLRFRRNNSETCKVYSENFKNHFEINLNDLKRSEIEWHNYIIGVIFHINVLKPNSIKGFDCNIYSNLPLGSGVSSSAALECGVAKGLNELFDIGLTDLEIINISKDAEHTFVGTKCGIMDQFAVVKGAEDHLLLLNCETLEHELIPADFGDYRIILLNTNVSHNLATSEYNIRRDECSTALEAINKKYPQYTLLAQVSPEIIQEFENILPHKIFNRALYITKENRRTLYAVECLKNKDIIGFGEWVYKSHRGLTNLFEVSCEELDFLVDFTHNLDYVVGARMMGGGFGGCTINIIHKDYCEEFINIISPAYQEKFNINLTPITVAIGNGVSKI